MSFRSELYKVLEEIDEGPSYMFTCMYIYKDIKEPSK